MLVGVDVSDNNPGVDWQALARTCQFAIIKATENDDYRNTMLAVQDGRARFYGLEVAYYHFAQPNKAHWSAQAQKFAREVFPLRDTGNPLALDLERGDGDLTDWVLNFTAAIELMCGRTPMLYSSPSFIAEHLRPVADLKRIPLWLASWGVRAPVAPEPWDSVAVWQDSASWTAPGQSVELDRDRFLGASIQDFRNLGAEVAGYDVERTRIFLRETAVTLEGWASELERNAMDGARRQEVASQMYTRAAEARSLDTGGK